MWFCEKLSDVAFSFIRFRHHYITNRKNFYFGGLQLNQTSIKVINQGYISAILDWCSAMLYLGPLCPWDQIRDPFF
jgi:hypothetical protein